MESRQMIERALASGYEFKPSSYISSGIDIFKKNPGGYLGFVVLFGIIYMIINFIPFLGMFIWIIIGPALGMGFAIAAHRQEKMNDLEFGNFFKGFDHIAQLIVANIILMIIFLIIALPLIFMLGFSFFSAMGSGDVEAINDFSSQMAGMGIWILVVALLFMYIAISLRWTNNLIVFHKYDAVSAIKTSWQLVHKNWFSHLVFMLLCLLLALGGLILLVIGLLFAYPIILVSDYAGYADVTGLLKSDSVIDEIGVDQDMV
ncbi:MAG: BPSS1780 family membrane protein [Saprospiraceae bacterium]